MLLMNFQHAHYKGDITSTSPKLTSGDFAAFMAIVERSGGGRLLHFSRGYWQAAAADSLGRMRHRAKFTADVLERNGKLLPGGIGLAGWIEKRVSQGECRTIEELDYGGLQALIIGLTAYAAQNGISLGHERQTSADKNESQAELCGAAFAPDEPPF